jgi:hypothetical protein
MAIILDSAKTLAGDVRDYLLEFIQVQRAQWPLLNEAQQQAIIDEASTLSVDLVSRMVDVIAVNDLPYAKATLGRLVLTDKGLEAKLLLSRSDPTRQAIFDSVGAEVIIIASDAAKFYGERRAARAKADQGELDLGLDAIPLPQPNGAMSDDDIPPAPGRDGAIALGRAARLNGVLADANPFDAENAPKEHEGWALGWDREDKILQPRRGGRRRPSDRPPVEG